MISEKEIIKLVENGASYRDIEANKGVDKSRVWRIIKKHRAKIDETLETVFKESETNSETVSKKPRVSKVTTKTKEITPEEIEDFAERITEESLHYKKARRLLKRITHKYGTDGIARDAFVVKYTLMVVNYILAGKLPEEV